MTSFDLIWRLIILLLLKNNKDNESQDKMKNKEIATALDVKKKDVDVAVNALAMEGKVEFLYLGTSYVTLPKA